MSSASSGAWYDLIVVCAIEECVGRNFSVICFGLIDCYCSLVLTTLIYFILSCSLQVGTHAKDIQEAQGMIIPVLMPLMLFSGFFLPYEEIPFFFRWLYEISFLRYAFNVLKINQWQDVTFDDCSPEGDVALCQVSPRFSFFLYLLTVSLCPTVCLERLPIFRDEFIRCTYSCRH